MRIFLAGGSGAVGSRLIPKLLKRGDQVVLLTRNAAATKEKLEHKPEAPAKGGIEYVEGDPTQPGQWMEKVAGCDAVVNLVGEGIFNRRWSAAFKETLRTSRIESTRNIVTAITNADANPKVLVNGSAIGYYGFHGDEELTEADGPGDDFLAQLSVEWEGEAWKVEETGVRLVLLRTGVVLDQTAGALQQMMTPFKMFAGGKVGSGKQYVSWVHHEDEVGLILFALDNENVSGPINATAPAPVTNKQLAKALGRAMGRPSFFPTPGFMLRVVLGPVAGLVTKGQRVMPKQALELGYEFKYPTIDGALGEIIGG